MLTENALIEAIHSNFERELRKKKLKFISKILLLTMICGDALFLSGFAVYHLHSKWVEVNQSIYPTEPKDNKTISPTAIIWIKTKEECLRTDRVWKDEKCLDSEWSHLF